MSQNTKTLVMDKGRVLVQTMPTHFQPKKQAKSRNKGVMVTCPCCGKSFQYSLIVKQFAVSRYDQKPLLEIISQTGRICSGALLRKYTKIIGKRMTGRHLNNIVRHLASLGLVKIEVRSLGRHGRTTWITFVPKNV